jgi:hypothetical protein
LNRKIVGYHITSLCDNMQYLICEIKGLLERKVKQGIK